MKKLLRKYLQGAALAVAVCAVTPVMAQETEPYAVMLREHSAAQPGLAEFAKALELFDMKSALGVSRELDEIVKNGWPSTVHPAVAAAFQSQRAALGAVAAAAQKAEAMVLPPTDFTDPNFAVPNFLKIQLIFKFFAADARRQEAAGNFAGAASRARELLLLSQVFRRSPQQPLITRLIGLAGMETGMNVFESLLRKPNLQPEIVSAIGGVLFPLTGDMSDLRDHILCELPVSGSDFWTRMRATLADEAGLQAMSKQSPEMVSSIRAAGARGEKPEDDAQIKAARAVFREELSRPMHESLGEAGVERLKSAFADPVLGKALTSSLPSPRAYYIRSGHALARTRALTILVALKMNKPEVAQSLLDPFTGKPFVVTESVIYSLGPDKQDQSGAVEFSTKDDKAPGDIVVRR